MQNTIGSQQISFRWGALTLALVAIALIVGFLAGFALSESPAAAHRTTAPVQAQSIQRLADLNEMLYPSSAPSIAIQPQRNQRLYDLNEMYYPSQSSEPLFWNGRPH